MTAATARERRIGFACAFSVLFIWSGFLVSSRLSPQQGFTPYDMLALRHLGSALASLPLVVVWGLPRIPLKRAAALCLFAGFGFPMAAYVGFTYAPASHGGVLLPGLLPFYIAAVWWVAFGEGWSRRRLLSLLLVGVGTGLLAWDTFGGHPGAWRGDLLFVAGGVSWAVYMALVRRWGVRALDATLAVALLGAPVTLPLWWLFAPSGMAAAPVGATIYHLIYQGGLSVIGAGFLFTRAMLALGAATSSAITSLVPALTALAAWPLLGEPLGAAGLVGLVVVTAGMIAGVLQGRQPRG